MFFCFHVIENWNECGDFKHVGFVKGAKKRVGLKRDLFLSTFKVEWKLLFEHVLLKQFFLLP